MDVRFGLIGYGLFGTHHANAIKSTSGAKLVSIAVRSEESRQAVREAHPDVDVTGDFRQLIARDDIDVIDIVVPNNLHYPVALAALESGKHILLEKPMALAVDHCDQLLRVARQRERIIAINHELRHSSLWGGVKRLIDEGVIGRPTFVLIELSRFPYRLGSEGWRWDIQRVGNWILEEPIHFFDLARWYLSASGPPISIYARANSRHPDHPELNDNFSAIVSHADGAYAVISQTLSAFGHHVTAKVSGLQGTIHASWSAPDARSDRPTFQLNYGMADDTYQVDLAKPTGELLELADQISMMVGCVRQDRQPICSGEDGRWSTLLCLTAQQSVDGGKLVPIAG